MSSAGGGHTRLALRRRWAGADRVFSNLTTLFAAGVGGLFVLIVLLLAKEASPAWHAFGPSFIWGSGTFSSEVDTYSGALPFIFGTLVTSLLALAIAIPVAVGTAVALVELMPRWLSHPVGLFIELLAAVPSIIFGIWGVAVIVPVVRNLRPETFGQTKLAAGIVLAIMILPILTSITRDMLKAVPASQREAALALGATPWEVTWRIILPNARSGIMAGAILALGRAIGETMAVILVIGFNPRIAWDLLEGGATLAGVIATSFGESQGIHRSALIEIGLVMLALSLMLSIAARLVVRTFGRKVTT